jgi:Ca2+-binding RTX toxin-like protein
MATATVIGTNASNEFLYGVTGADTKIEGKGGIDYMFGANGNDLLIPGTGNKNLMFGLGGTDTFQFTKFSTPGGFDVVGDWELGRDKLSFGPGLTVTEVKAHQGPADDEFNMISLSNDPKVFDLFLTVHVVDSTRVYDFQIKLVDGLKNMTWHADQVEAYLATFGFTGSIELVPSI